jgi:hypothetical protein
VGWECAKHKIDESGTVTFPTQYTGKTILQNIIRESKRKKPLWMSQNNFREDFRRKPIQPCQTMPNMPDMPEPYLPGDSYERWWWIVEEYTRQHLTNEMDLLP